MKILTFYSYKGGQGRTTAMANLGSCLYRLGYNVVLMDLDIEAPGLPAKFGYSVFDDPHIEEHGGVMDYLLDSYARMRPVESIADRCLPPLASKNSGNSETCIRLIPTGFVDTKKNYFQSFTSSGWKYLSRISESGPNKILFFEGLRAAIKELRPEPDYLLIDVSAGNTAFGQVSLIALAETVFCFFGPDPENVDGMKYILNELDEIPAIRRKVNKRYKMNLSTKPINIFPALCRIPPFLRKQDITKITRSARHRLYENLERKHPPISLLHSDSDLERKWELRIPLTGKPMNVQLTRDYLNLLVRAWPQVRLPQGPASMTVRTLLRDLELDDDVNEQYRVFRVTDTQGVMINLSDNERNVSFKVNTFCAMLTDIHDGIVRRLAPEHAVGNQSKFEVEPAVDDQTKLASESAVDNEIKQATEDEFYNAGYTPGAGFGKSLIVVWKDQLKMTDDKRIEEWCKFDSSVGFGNISRSALAFDDEGHVKQGTIVVGHNFLAENRGAKEANLCKLLAGYIAGVIENILRPKVRVEHPEGYCMRVDHARQSCDFLFVVAESPVEEIL